MQPNHEKTICGIEEAQLQPKILLCSGLGVQVMFIETVLFNVAG
jgi:hypothetical protein